MLVRVAALRTLRQLEIDARSSPERALELSSTLGWLKLGVEELDADMAGLGLRLRCEGSEPLEVRDVQIWTDGGFSCRLVESATAGANGSPSAQRSIASKSS